MFIFFVSDNKIKIKIDINLNVPDNLRSCATCATCATCPHILRAVHKRGCLRIGYCEKCYCLNRGAGNEDWRK
jgi:hypothetical protein